ncbi:ABC transporter ATP-binding protein [Ruminiclostridium cellulolyticum]|uniref:ABC transporter related n=1 Tax=Ruminiclostridium cellulolyticum (strain ATCC 35319 / DSM 5812 / JCM 6584 / H10) TaxID=394503 RepID=B8I0Z5_RUMCH|nr:ABC transporter ATP-binding protein [Ruminiclostridium cellulolyticum]ACL77551.1 ABC transporter related [Ruminiclostridium cellulolyticum H10]
MLAIEVVNLNKQYKNGVKALDNLSLKVNQGEIFSLLGPNGAGKSSLINILTTYYEPTSGKITVLGKDLCKEPGWVRTQIACVAQHVSIDAHLSLMENMMFQSKLYKVDKHLAKERIASLIDNFELSGYLKYPTSSYSGGVKRRLDIAMNMISAPKILFLDEPTVAMDVESRKAMWKMLLKIREDYGTTIFLTTHYLEEADQLSDTICIMKDGKEIAQGTPADLRNHTRQNMLRIGFSSVEETKKYKKALDDSGLTRFTKIEDRFILAGVDDSRKDFKTVNKWLLDKDAELNAIEIVEPSLEDVFLSLISSREQREEERVC